MAKLREYNIENKLEYLEVEAKGIVESKKYFPIFEEKGKKRIFKPLSKTKPYSTPLFCYSEAYWSYFMYKYFDERTPIYNIALCSGLSSEFPKYYDKGCIVDDIRKPGERIINLLELFRMFKDKDINLEDYVNYCEIEYDYSEILRSNFFTANKRLGEALAEQILCSILRRDENFHYENILFIEKDGKIESIAPMLDMEYSMMFMHPDDLKKHKSKFSLYDEGMGVLFEYNNNEEVSFKKNHDTFVKAHNEGSIYDEFDAYKNFNLRKNLQTIVELYPHVCTKFIEKLEKLKLEVEKVNLNFNEEFVGDFSSSDWEHFSLLIKDGIGELDKRYKEALEKANSTRMKLNKEEFNERLRKEVLWSIDKLIYMLNFYLDIKNGKIKSIINYHNSTLYGKVERVPVELLERYKKMKQEEERQKKLRKY